MRNGLYLGIHSSSRWHHYVPPPEWPYSTTRITTESRTRISHSPYAITNDQNTMDLRALGSKMDICQKAQHV